MSNPPALMDPIGPGKGTEKASYLDSAKFADNRENGDQFPGSDWAPGNRKEGDSIQSFVTAVSPLQCCRLSSL